MNKKYFQHLLDLASTASEEISQRCPSTIQPFINVLVYLCTLLFLLVLIPILLPFSVLFRLLHVFKKPTNTSYEKLETDLRSIWCTESSVAALKKLRQIHQQLLEQKPDGLILGVLLPPYGKFKMRQYFQVLRLLYQYEASHQCWYEANTICDEVLDSPRDEKSHVDQFIQRVFPQTEWIVNKARALVKLEGTLAAQQYLLKHLDAEDHENPINMYFYELREKTVGSVNDEKTHEGSTQKMTCDADDMNEKRPELPTNSTDSISPLLNVLKFPQKHERNRKDDS